MEKKYVHQWQVPGRPDDGKEIIWTEVKFSAKWLAEMLGCAPGTRLISSTVNLDHSTMTLTFEEPREALCPSQLSAASSAGASSAGPATG